MKIKICGVKNVEDLTSCVNCNVNYVGINFYNKSQRYAEFGNILEYINKTNLKNTQLVAVFYHNNFLEIEQIISQYQFSIVQLSSKYDTGKMIKLRKTCELWQVVDIFCYQEYDELCDRFLFDNSHGSGILFNQAIPPNINKPCGIAGGINSSNIIYLIKKYPTIDLVDIASGVEESDQFSEKKLTQIINSIKQI